MAIAGKVAITLSTENGGAWSTDVTYDRLVAVKHNNNLYISRKTVANVEPPNNEFWFLALEGFSGDDIEDIIDGTTQVGNAKTLDGHGAEYFAPLSDLANYFKNTGGKIGNNTYNPLDIENLSSDEIKIRFSGKSGNLGYLGMTGKGKLVVTSSVDWVDRELLHTGNMASHVLPLDGGGTVTSNLDTPLYVKTTNQQGIYLGFTNKDGRTNYIGFDETGDAHVHNKGKLLHTGNKPTGTYTGNGDDTQRTINVGGIGDTLRIKGTNGHSVLVDYNGAWGVKSDGTAVSLGRTECHFESGQLVLATTSSIVNNNTSTFTWRLL